MFVFGPSKLRQAAEHYFTLRSRALAEAMKAVLIIGCMLQVIIPASAAAEATLTMRLVGCNIRKGS